MRSLLTTRNINEPIDLIPVPSGLSAYLLLIPLRGQEECRKEAEIGHWRRSENQSSYDVTPLKECH
jgi:hypothetical protein